MNRIATIALIILAAFGAYAVGSDAAGRVGWPAREPRVSAGLTVLPGLVSYQGRLLDPATGAPVPDGTRSLQFNIWSGAVGGVSLWSETQPAVQTTDGVFSVLLGSVTPLDVSTFNGSETFLEVQVGADPPLSPRQPFATVAYAFVSQFAKDSNKLNGFSASQFVRSDIAATKSGNLTLNNDLLLATNGIINPAGVDGNVTVGSSTSDVDGDNLVVEDGSICAGRDGCNLGGTGLGDGFLSLDRDLRVGDDSGVDTDIVFFDQAVESLQWQDALSTFTLSDDLDISGTLSLSGANISSPAGLAIDPAAGGQGAVIIGDSVSSESDNLAVFDGGLCVGDTGCLNVNIADGFLSVDHDARIGDESATDNDSLLFDQGAENITWDEGGIFTVSDDLYVGGSIAFGSAEEWVDGGSNIISSATNSLFVEGGVLCVDDNLGTAAFECPGDGSPAAADGSILADGAITAAAFDLAERFPVGDDSEPQVGDLVIFDGGASVVRSDGTSYDSRIAGIVSGDPGLVLGWEQGGDVPVALQGRVPLRVTLENGPIAVGDTLTSSSTPGAAMKATEPGATIGIALEPFDGSAGDNGSVLTFVSRDSGSDADTFAALEARLAAVEQNSGDGDTRPSPTSPALAPREGVSLPWVIAIAAAAAITCIVCQTAAVAYVRRRPPLSQS